MWLVLGFVALGFLIGNLVGLSATSVVTALLGLLFAFAGSSIIAFLHQLKPDDRKLAGQAILGVSLSCLLGVYSGVLVNQYRILSPPERRWLSPDQPAKNDSSAKARVSATQSWLYSQYVRADFGTKVNEINARYRNKELTAPAAFDSLFALVTQPPAEKR